MSILNPEQPKETEITASQTTPLIELEADITSDGSYGRMFLTVTSTEVRVSDASGAITFQAQISDIKHARNEQLVGGGRIELTMDKGALVPIISYTHTLTAKFSEAARGIEQLAKGEPLLITLKKELLRCAKCNRLLPEADGVCPACVNRGKTLMRIAAFLKPYKSIGAGLVLCSILQTSLALGPPYIQKQLIDRVLGPRTNVTLLFQFVGVWLAVVACAVMVEIMRGRLTAVLAGNIAADLRSTVYRSIEFLQLNYFDKKQVGAIASRVTHDTDRVWGFLVDGLPYFITNGLLFVGVIGILFWVDPILALCVLSPIPVMVGISVFYWKSLSGMFHRVGQKWARLHMHLNESLNGIRVVKAFAKEDGEFDKFKTRNRELFQAGVNADVRWYTIFGALTFCVSLATLIYWTVGGTMVFNGRLTLGEFWMVQAYLALIYGPLQWFAQVNNWFSRAMAGAERIFEVMDTEPEKYGTRGKTLPIKGEVKFDNVRFGYDKSNPVLKGMSFTAKPGEMIGLVGKSGAGKSTTINLICRFYEPDAGAILIDGEDSREIDLQNMRSQIGIVLQEPFLFNGTIAENIAYGKPGAGFDEVVAAARAANAHNFILGKADSYDTMVGERGAKLSGGERQRISIARAILHNPRILILDEATSSVDVETEKQIQEAIAHLIKGRTTFAIAHRLSTLRNADRLVVLEKGEIAEIGTHAELMEKKGVFFNLVQTQSKIQEIVGMAYVEGDETR